MQQLPEQLAQTDQIPLITHGFAERSTSAHQQGFPRRDTQCSDHQEEELPQADSPVEEEVDSLVEEEADSLEEEEADLQGEDSQEALPLNKEEDHQETN